MAHHNSTPQPILDAPTSEPLPIIEHTGPNRQQRRHVRTKTGATHFVPKHLQQKGTNETHDYLRGGTK